MMNPPIWKWSSAAGMPGGPNSWRTKKLNSRRGLGDQTTRGTNKIQEAGKGRKSNIHIEKMNGDLYQFP